MRHSLVSMAAAVVLVAFHAGGPAAAEPAKSRPKLFAGPSVNVRATDVSAQNRERMRERRPRRVRIYTPRGPGPNSVRICHSHYEYEHRLSGTVIVPRENCYWQG